jgi:hypothetical protein
MATKRATARRPRRAVKRKLSSPKPPARHVKREPVNPGDVTLVAGKGSSDRGGGPGGHYWHIQAGGKRAGYVFINIIRDEVFGEHPSIQIHINQSERGKQIGRIAYRLACEQSNYDKIYAHMRKSNIASRRAAEEAGFKVVEDERIPQLSMVWQRAPRDK